MTHWQRDVPGSFSHADPPPTLIDRAVTPAAQACLLLALASFCGLVFAAIIYGR